MFKNIDLQKSCPLLMRKHLIPGIALALITNGKIATTEFGVKNNISLEPVDLSTVFEGASLSKPVVAYTALKLCESGILNIDKPLSGYFSDYKSIIDSRLSSVTLRHVLSHTSGFHSANLMKGELLKLQFDPGSQFAYSGESFRYLAAIIEHITGVPLEKYILEHVFQPLKMNDSSFVWEDRFEEQAASPHDRKGRPTEKWKPASAVASFSLHTTASDFAKFMIGASNVPLMFEINYQINEFIAWGLGWGVETTPNGVAFWHSGDNGTFQCFAFMGKKVGLVMMTNSANGFKVCRDLLGLVGEDEHPLIDWEEFDLQDETFNEEFLANWWKY